MTHFSQLRANLEMARKKLDMALAHLDLFMSKNWARERLWRLMSDAHDCLKAADENVAAISELESRIPEGR